MWKRLQKSHNQHHPIPKHLGLLPGMTCKILLIQKRMTRVLTRVSAPRDSSLGHVCIRIPCVDTPSTGGELGVQVSEYLSGFQSVLGEIPLRSQQACSDSQVHMALESCVSIRGKDKPPLCYSKGESKSDRWTLCGIVDFKSKQFNWILNKCN